MATTLDFTIRCLPLLTPSPTKQSPSKLKEKENDTIISILGTQQLAKQLEIPPSSPSKPIHLPINRVKNIKRGNLFAFEEQNEKESFASPVKREKTESAPAKCKVEREFIAQIQGVFHFKVTLKYKDNLHTLKLLDNQGLQHEVWLSDQGVIVKTYEQHVNPTTRRAVVKGDVWGRDKAVEFIKTYQIQNVRVANLLNNPIEEGILLMEFIDGDKSFYKNWEGAESMTSLSSESMQILSIARHMIELMWKHKYDLGDFKPDNSIWKDNELVIIDYTFVSEEEADDLEMNLKTYIKKWSNCSSAVRDFLYENMPELKALHQSME